MHDRAVTLRAWLVGHVERYGLPNGYAERFTQLDDFGYRPKREVLPLLLQEFGLSHDPELLFRDFWTHLDHAQPMPHAHAVLRELRARGLRLGIVTNGGEEAQTRCLEACGLAGLVDDVVISKAVGLSKPAPAIYRLALARLGVTARETWCVGDSPRNDVWGPQQVGLRAAYLATGHALDREVPDTVLGGLRDVLDLGYNFHKSARCSTYLLDAQLGLRYHRNAIGGGEYDQKNFCGKGDAYRAQGGESPVW